MDDVGNLLEHVAILVTAITGFVVAIRRSARNGHRIEELEERFDKLNGGTEMDPKRGPYG